MWWCHLSPRSRSSTKLSFGELRRMVRKVRSRTSAERLEDAKQRLAFIIGKDPFPHIVGVLAGDKLVIRALKAGAEATRGFSADEIAHVEAVNELRNKGVEWLMKTLISTDDIDAAANNINALYFVINYSQVLWQPHRSSHQEQASRRLGVRWPDNQETKTPSHCRTPSLTNYQSEEEVDIESDCQGNSSQRE
jgi:hypothetical protein